jgi:hypothetical protein
MVTGDFGSHENANLFRNLLEFESQKFGLPIEFSLVDLERPPNGQFCKKVQVLCHGIGMKHDLTFPFADGSVSFKAQSFHMKGLVALSDATREIIGFVGEDYMHPVAHIQGNKLFIYLNILDLPTGHADGQVQGQNVLAKICDFIFSKAMPVLKENIDNYDYRDERARYAEIKCTALKAKVREIEQNVASNEIALRDCTDGIIRYTRALQTDRLILEDLRARTERKKADDVEREYLSLLKLTPNPYKEIQFNSEELSAYTNTIFIEHHGEEYEIGEFEVSIAFETGRLSIKNLTREQDGYQHPHVSDSAAVCLGNISTGVSKLIAEHEYIGALTILHEFLKSYNADDAYKKIEYWSEGGWHDYDSCIEDSSISDCLDCSDYDCPFYDNRYSRCSENSSTEDCIGCGLDCSYRQDAMDNCNSEHSAFECRSCRQICSYQGDEDNCYEDSDDGAECIGCSLGSDCSYYREKAEETEETTDELTAILAQEA